MKPNLHLVSPPSDPAPDMSYEWRQRQHALSRNWEAVHTGKHVRVGRTDRAFLRLLALVLALIALWVVVK